MSGHDEHREEAALVAASAPPVPLAIFGFELRDEPELSNGSPEEVNPHA